MLTKSYFIPLGSAGSGKGEFIWNLMKDHENSNQTDYKLFYLDIENLICDNIKKRVKELLRENRYARHSPSSTSDIWNDGELNQSEQLQEESLSCTNSRSNLTLDEEENEVATLTRVKGYLSEFANFVTCYWIQTLIADEIFSRTDESVDHNVFLINLIPNRISYFKRCLYLNQTPNFYHTPFDFYAINLINEESTKKDLDILDGASFQNEANTMFVKYFRSLNKLTHVKIHPLISIKNQELKIKLVSSSDPCAVSLTSREQLNQLIKGHDRSQLLCLNIEKFTTNENSSHETTNNNSNGTSNTNNNNNNNNKSRLFFVINNKIELDDVVIEVDTCNINSTLRYFVKELKDVYKDMNVIGPS